MTMVDVLMDWREANRSYFQIYLSLTLLLLFTSYVFFVVVAVVVVVAVLVVFQPLRRLIHEIKNKEIKPNTTTEKKLII